MAFVLGAMLLGACGGAPAVDDDYVAQRHDRIPALLRSSADDSAGAAGVDGVLRLLEDEACFVIEQDLGTSRMHTSLVVWPRRTEPLERDGRLVGVRVPTLSGRHFVNVEVGDHVRAGGRYALIERVGLPPELPDACLGDAPEVTFVDDVVGGGGRFL